MKTQLATIIATVALLVGTTTLTVANNKTDNGSSVIATAIPTNGNIDAIDVSGNVDVYLVNGDYDAVNIYSDYYGQNAVVKNSNGVLSIASYSADKLVVFVTVADLQSITAHDNAAVRSYGDALSAKSLDIDIKDNATAQLKLDVIGASVTADNKSNVQLTGTIDSYELAYSPSAKVNMDGVKSQAARKTQIEQPAYGRLHAMTFGVNAGLLN